MAHTHSVIDDDLHFIIDPSTREIGNGSQKVKLMQYDHNSEQFTFEIPRFVEGHDMSLCNSIRVNYININKSTREQHPGVYEVSYTKVEGDNIIFSWLVSRNATQYVGPLNFLIKFMCFDENDYITYEWHTDIFKSASVSTGMNNEESIEEVYPDILEKWKNDVLAEEASRITAESERVTAESERVTAESERVTAESERVTAESERVTAESERVTAESERAAAESERVTAESERVTAESERAAAESERATAESERVTAESERAAAESERAAAESERATAESERVTAESERAAAESERANTFAGYETEINQFKNEIVTGKDSATDNTKFAIGKAEPNLEVPTMEEFNQLAEDMTGKLSEPAEGLAVGKYFRIAAIDENGHAVLEAVDAPKEGLAITPAGWPEWTAEEQAAARDRLGITEDLQQVFILSETWEEATSLNVEVNSLSHFRIFITLETGTVSSVTNYGLISCTNSSGNKTESLFELGTLTESSRDNAQVAYCKYDIGETPVMTRWLQAGSCPQFTIRGGLIRNISTGSKIQDYMVSKIQFPPMKGDVRIAIWGR